MFTAVGFHLVLRARILVKYRESVHYIIIKYERWEVVIIIKGMLVVDRKIQVLKVHNTDD